MHKILNIVTYLLKNTLRVLLTGSLMEDMRQINDFNLQMASLKLCALRIFSNSEIIFTLPNPSMTNKYMHACKRTHARTHKQTHTHTRTHKHTHTNTQNIHMLMHAHTHICTRTHDQVTVINKEG